MLNLDSIQFKVDTNELDIAAKKIEALGTSVSALSVDLSKLNKASSEVSKTHQEAAKATSDAAKAEQELSKAKSTTTDSTKTATVSMDAATRAVEKQTLAMKIFRGEAVDLNDQVLTLGSSFTKGQSGQLANLKLLGATNDQLKVLAGSFEDFNKITSSNTFDNSAAGLGKLSKEIFELTKVNDLMKRGIALTRDEIVNLVRDGERLTQQFKSEGLSAQQTVQALGGLEAQTIKLAKEKNELIARTHASEIAAKAEANAIEKSSNDAAKASQFLAREMQRVDSVITGFNDNLNITASNRLLKFREQLKASGVDAVTAEKMLKTYEERLKTINQVSQTKAKNSREEELKYLARATSVQLGDIGISLAGGQNPLLVLIQQGDQLRGVLNQVGASGNEMQKALSMAFSQIVVGSKDVVVALGSFVVGAFVDAGKAITDFALKATGAGKHLEYIRYQLTLMRNEGSSTAGVLLKFFEKLPAVIGVGVGAMVAFATATTVAAYQVVKANDDLARSLVSTGAQLGFTVEYAQNLAGVLTGMGNTRVDVLNAFSEISNSGKVTSESFLQVADAALTIERVGGPAIKETVKLFGELKDKTTETLIKYASQTGLVTAAQIEQIDALVRAGKELSATALATDVLTAAIKEQAKIMYASLSPMGKLWIDIKDGINNAWGAVQDFASSDTLLDPMVAVLQSVLWFASKVWYTVRSIAESFGGLGATVGAVMTDIKNLDMNFTMTKTVWKGIEETEAARAKAHDADMDRIMQRGKYSKESLLVEAQAAAKRIETNAKESESLAARLKVDADIRKQAEAQDTKTLTRQQYINKAVDEKNKALGQGNVLSAESLRILEKTAGIEWDKANKPKKAPKSDAIKEAETLSKYYEKAVEKANDLGIEINGTVQNLTKSEKALLDLRDDSLFKKLAPVLQWTLEMQLQNNVEIERQLETTKKITEFDKIGLKYKQDLSKIESDNTAYLLLAEDSTKKLNSSYELRLSLLGKTKEQQEELKDQAEFENKILETNIEFEKQRLKIKEDFEKLSRSVPDDFVGPVDLSGEEKAYKELDEQRKKDLIAIHGEVAVKAAEKYDAKMRKIAETLSDAITTALFEGGQAGTKKLKDYITSIFRNAINIQVNAVVNAAVSSVTRGITNTLTGGASSGAGGMLSGLGSVLSYGKMFGSAMADGWGATMAGNTYGAISGGLGAVGTGTASTVTGLGQAAGAAGPYVAAVLAAIQIADGLSGGHEVTTQTGIKGKFSQEGFSGSNFQDWKNEGDKLFAFGSLFGGISMGNSSSGTNISAIDPKQSKALGDAFKIINNTTADFAVALGEQAGPIKRYTKEITLALGSDAEANRKLIADMLEGIANDAAKMVIGTEYSKEGESTAATLERLATSITVVNGAFRDMGQELVAVSAGSAQAASDIVEAFGGVSEYAKGVSSYFQNYYTEKEQKDATRANVTRTLEGAGYKGEIPTTRTEFRAMVDEASKLSNLNTEAGRKFYATLIGVSDAFATITESSEEATKALEKEAEEKTKWQQKLDILTGKYTERQISLQNDLASVTDDSTKALIKQVYALEDAAAAQLAYSKEVEELSTKIEQAKTAVTSARNAVDSVLNESTNAYLSALSAVESAQERIASIQLNNQIEIARATNEAAKAMQELGASLRKFIDETAQTPTALFSSTLASALGGNKEAMSALPGAATGAIDVAKGRASTSAEFKLERAKILSDVARVAVIAEAAGRNTVVEPSAPSELATAQSELAKAQLQLNQALSTALAINAPLTASVTDLITKYNTAQAELIKVTAQLNATQASLDAIKANTAGTLMSIDQLKQSLAVNLIEKFDNLDTSINGLLSFDEFKTGFTGLASEATLKTVFSELDVNGDAQVSRLEAMKNNTNVMVSKFDMLDTSIDGLLTFSEFRQGFYGMASDSTLQSIFRELDVNGDGQLSRLEAIKNATAPLNDTFAGQIANNTNRVTFQLDAVHSAIGYADSLLAQLVQNSNGANGGLFVRFARGAGPYQNVYAKGGAFTNGVVDKPTSFHNSMMGEAGPEAIVPLVNVGGSLGVRSIGNQTDNTELVLELQALRQEVVMLRAETRATAINTSKIAKEQNRTIESDVVKVKIIP